MIRPSASWLVLLIACDPSAPPPSGTSVGNPGKNAYRIAPPNEIAVGSAIASGLTVDLLGCDGRRASVVAGDAVDLVASDRQPVPGGSWCGLTVWFDELAVSGTSGGATDAITLDPPAVWTLWTAEPVVVDGGDYVLEVGGPGWISPSQVTPDGDLHGVVNPDSEVAPLLLQNLETGTGWYEDDGDGVLSDEERAAGTLASAAWLVPPAFGAEDTGAGAPVAVEGCGNCSTGGPPSVGSAVALAIALARRRRGAPRSAGSS